MTINCKYTIGDRLYYIENKRFPTTKVCDLCDGEKELELKKKHLKVICPKCKGEGIIIVGEQIKSVVNIDPRNIVSRITVNIGQIAQSIKYVLDKPGQIFPHTGGEIIVCELFESSLYSTEKEAQDICDEENSKGARGSEGTTGGTGFSKKIN